MGQSSSRGGRNSDEQRPFQSRSFSWRSSSLFGGQRHTQDRPSDNRRYSSSGRIASLLRQSSSDAAAPATQTDMSQTLRRRSRSARPASFSASVPRLNATIEPTSDREPSTGDLIEEAVVPAATAVSSVSQRTTPLLQAAETSETVDHLPPLSPQRSPTSEHRRPLFSRHNSSLADRISNLTPHRDFRNITASLRRRRSPTPRADSDPNAALSRLLQVAAAATAATLMGANPDDALGDLHNAAGNVDGEDGTFTSFLQALRGGRLAGLGQSNRNGTAGTADSGATNGQSPLEFFRMFRFGSANTTRRREGGTTESSSSESNGNQETASDPDQFSQQGDPRMVPVLIVGIRALDAHLDTPQGSGNAVPSFLDALAAAPVSSNIDTDIGTGAIRARRRRASMGGINISSTARDALRRLRPSLHARPRSFAAVTELSNTPLNDSAVDAEVPPQSRNNIADNAPQDSSTAQSTTPSRRGSFLRRVSESLLESTVEEENTDINPRPRRRRRMSESDRNRHGSGSPRRNGVLVEPHEAPAEGGRSWIIYILGGSYPENHPILSAPSLFTDSPTYEDMLRLSSLLGPAKPPVASSEEVAAAAGLYKIKLIDGAVHAVAEGDIERLVIPGDRCLVCLCEYEDGEEARRLAKCSHWFHRECIDQWLTTGRNSCPLCRGTGVESRSHPSAAEAGPSTAT